MSSCACPACAGTLRGLIRHLRLLSEACPIRCSICGRFIGFEDLRSGRADYRVISPDSAQFHEGVCRRCKERLEVKR